MTLLLLLGWILAMILTAFVDAQIVIHTTESEAARPLPKYVQNLSDADYAQWARWQNAMAEKASEDFSWRQQPYLQGIQTVVTMNGASNGNVSSYSERGDRGTYGGSQMYGRTSGSATSLTLPVRVRNPDYRTKPVRIYNPFCRPKTDTTHDTDGARIIDPYTALEPDWDNLYCIHNGRVVSVSNLANEPDYVPLPLEALYEFKMLPYFGERLK
jgi:hypothetical protein